MNETWIDKIKEGYWSIVPYDWRPVEMWYRFKCWAWGRHTTIKPRYLGHVKYDRCTVLPHMMFEILCQFVEQECSPSPCEWYGEYGPKITINGKEKFVMDEMKDLIAWWHDVWNKEVGEVEDILWAEAEKHPSVFETQGAKFPTEEDRAIYKTCLMACSNLEHNMMGALEARLHRLVNVTYYFST
jgi:hypothetical protein